jgi:DNA-binding NtrC family response regulator
MMPKLSGIDLLGLIRKQDDDVAVIILTGYPSLETATASIEHDVSAYIKKPFSIDEFRAVIERIAKKKGLVLRKEDELHQTIGRNIRELRKARNLTLKQMSRRTKLSVSLLSQIERAESSASVSSLFKVASALDVRITQLFGDF